MKNAANEREEGKDKLFNFRPALFAAVFLSFGIIFAYYRLFYDVSPWWLTALLPLGCVFFFCRDRRSFHLRGVALVCLAACFAVGFISFRYQVARFEQNVNYDGEHVVVGTVVSRSKNEEKTRVTLQDIYIDEKRVEGMLDAYLPHSFSLDIQIADKVVLCGRITTDMHLFNEFGFRSSAIRDNRCYQLTVEKGSVVGRADDIFLRLRSKMEGTLYAGMGETPAAVTFAVLTGDISGMEEGLSENMRYGGIAHIFAVSGLNIGALYAFCLLLFSLPLLRNLPRWTKFLLLAGIIILYSGICGFSASVVRAAIFCVLSYFSKLVGIKTDLLESLGISALGILSLQPSQLFDVGFQLTFAACAGLAFFTKPIGHVCDECRNLFVKSRFTAYEKPLSVGDRIYRWFSQMFSATLAAQIATAPLLIIRFGYLSGWALLLNCIFVPIVEAAFTLLLAVTVIASIFPVATPFLLYVPSVWWSALLLLFQAADFSTFALSGMQLSAINCVCYYAGLTFLTDKWNISKRLRVILFLLFAVGFMVTTLFMNV